ncbi:carboxylate-amine ligase [Marinactinospora thermotolerans]|uniref:carboxylate-amine ligase n=1 Tax=Marinactinospora thermotolerans TaxID=531310 RepID=UPI003D93F006
MGEDGRTDVPTMGVEEEFLLLDDNGDLAELGPEVLTQATEGSGEVQQELGRCQVESASPVSHDADELLGELRGLRRRLAASARGRGLRLAAVGAPLRGENDRDLVSVGPRYERMRDNLGPLLTAGYTCGCHVHVAIPDRETGVQVLNHLRPWLPVLLALTANSPFGDGADTTYASWRHVRWSTLPSAAPPPFFHSVQHYEESVDALLSTGAALDRNMVHWDARLSDRHPTLEVRICDVSATAEEATLVAVLIRGLVTTFLDAAAAGRPAPDLSSAVLRAQLWRAARDGLEGDCVNPATGELTPVHTALRTLVNTTRPALVAAGDLDFAEDVLATLRRTGGAARRQRAAFARRGRLQDVVQELARVTVGGLSAVGGDDRVSA